MKNSYRKQIKKNLVFKVIQRKRNNLYVKWKDYGNLFNSQIDKDDVVIEYELFSRTVC